MKIGILTFHRAENYGAVLQCYALTKYMQSLRMDVEVIDYYPSYFKSEYSSFDSFLFKEASLRVKLSMIVDYVLKFILRKKRSQGFKAFLSQLPLSQTFDEQTISFDGYSLVFVGSDQVWNKKLTHGEDVAFSGKIKVDNQVLASYAASTEFSFDIIELAPYYKSIMDRFDFVSVREKRFCDYLNSLNRGKSVFVVDPVLLLSKSQWADLSQSPVKNRYLLIYTVPQDSRVFQLANQVARELNLEIVEMVSKVRYIYKKRANQIATPQEFVGYFAHADFIVTTSFHGTAFSVLFNKQFYTVLLGTSVDERAKDLLSNIGLLSRGVQVGSIPKIESIDYSIVQPMLDKYISESKDYIQRVLDSMSS